MFTFPESEYQWCPQCAGNIRKDADYCRYCRKAISNRMLKKAVARSVHTIDEVSCWLPSFNTLITKLTPEFLERFEQADKDYPPGTIGLPDGADPAQTRRANRETGFCSFDKPEPHVIGLLYDILLSLHENGESIAELCQYKHLQLLELTPQEVAAEIELRKEEFQRNYQCKYCREYIFPDGDDCRFCGGNEDNKPKAIIRPLHKPIDTTLLKDVLVYESARRKMNELDPIPDDILAASGITADAVDQEIFRQRSSNALKPMPRFYKRMVELNIASYVSPEARSINALVELGSALDTKKQERLAEALIVYEHALQRTENNVELIHERGSVLFYLALLYQRKEDMQQYKHYHDMAQECKTYGMPDEMKELLKQTDVQSLKSLVAHDFDDSDPEKRLAEMEKMLTGHTELMEQMVAQMESAVPGLGEMMAGIGNILDSTAQTSRLKLEAEIAHNKGNLDEAFEIYNKLLAHTSESISPLHGTPNILCSLAEIKFQQGDHVAAENFFKEAMSQSNELREASEDIGRIAVINANFNYGRMLRDIGRLPEAEEKLLTAIKLQAENRDEMIARYNSERTDFSGHTAAYNTEYIKLLRLMNRNDEADKLEAETVQLQKEAEEANENYKKHREKYSQQMRDVMDLD